MKPFNTSTITPAASRRRVQRRALLLTAASAPWWARAQTPPARYQTIPETLDGIGKSHLGRPISRVMGWQGAAWLERNEREEEERGELLLRELQLRPGLDVADIGAGTGWYARRIAPLVALPASGTSATASPTASPTTSSPAASSPTASAPIAATAATPPPDRGRVYAVDVQPQMLRALQTAARQPGLGNIVPVLGAVDDVKLAPASVDLAFMVDVYHELEFPYEVLASIVRAVRPGGRVVFVEYRAEDPRVPIKPLHKMSEAQVKREAAQHPLVWERTAETLPWQHVVIFRRP